VCGSISQLFVWLVLLLAADLYMNFTKIKTKVMFDGNIHWFIMTTS